MSGTDVVVITFPRFLLAAVVLNRKGSNIGHVIGFSSTEE